MNLIIMLYRNGRSYSRACLKTLLAQTVPVQVLIVDNATYDGTRQWARAEQQRDTRILTLSYSIVVSVSKAWNDALNWAWRRGLPNALVVNNDIEIQPETLELLQHYAAFHGDVGMVTGVGRYPGETLGLPTPDTWNEQPHPFFSCYLIKRWAHERIGGFDEKFEGAYAEDCDFHLRLHHAGIQAVCIDLPFVHHKSGTLERADPAERQRIELNAARNREYFRAKHGCFPATARYDELFKVPAEPLDV